MLKVLILEKLGLILEKSAEIFAPKELVKANKDALEVNVLEISQSWYDEYMSLGENVND